MGNEIFITPIIDWTLKNNSKIGNKKLSDEYDFEVDYRLHFYQVKIMTWHR